MRRLLYISVSLFWIAALAACQNHPDDDTVITGKDLPVAVSFEVDIEPATVMSRAGIDENGLGDMYLLLFDENGLFLKRAKAEMQTSGSSGAGTFKAILPESRERRTIHFISNYDWNGFSDRDMLGKHENTIVPAMASADGMLFWHRRELPNGIYRGCITSVVELLRNMAKITVRNEDSNGTFRNASFAVYNKPAKGTLAPFDPGTGKFGYTSVPYLTIPGGTVSVINDDSFMSANGVDASYTYEKDNASIPVNDVANQVVIVKGEYQYRPYYYKLLMLDNALLEPLDVYRNYHYKITITKVGGEGYSTLEEALRSPANNNMSVSVDIADYPSISDGQLSLEVEKINVSLSKDDEILNLKITCQRVSNGALANNEISVSVLEGNPAKPVFDGPLNYDQVTGMLTAKGGKISDNVRTATIVVRAGSLRRDIKVVLMKPQKFENARFEPSVCSSVIGYGTQLKFTVPQEMEKYLPVKCYITANGLTVNDSRLEVEPWEQGWRYVYKISSTGPHSIGFKTNSSTSAEAAKLSAIYMEDAFPAYRSGSANYKLNDIHMVPERIPVGTGQEVALNFICATAGTTFTIATKYLGPADNESSLMPDGTGKYKYTSKVAGMQTIYFKTTSHDGLLNTAEAISITASGYEQGTAAVKNLLVNLKGRITDRGKPLHRLRNRVVLSTGVGYSGAGILGIFHTDDNGYFNTLVEVPYGTTLRIACFFKNLYNLEDMVKYSGAATNYESQNISIVYDANDPGTCTVDIDFNSLLPYILSSGRMVAHYNAGSNVSWNSAFSLCVGFVQNEVGGWRLPTRAELSEMYNNRSYIYNITQDREYWSADEYNSTQAYTVNLTNGSNVVRAKNSGYQNTYVRCVLPQD